MIEIRIHGRGGQGAVIASKVLASALFIEGKWVQAFPAFGVERRGAPVTAFLRTDQHPILLRCQIYHPDHLMILDPTLIEAVNVTQGLKEGGLILINTSRPPSAYSGLGPYRIATVDASEIAVAHRLGTPEHPIVNTAILGAYARASQMVQLGSILKAIEESVPQGADANVAAARNAYEQVNLSMLSEVKDEVPAR